MKKIHTLCENILKGVQDKQRVSGKPDILPISSLTEMDAFEDIDDNDYSNVVNYFRYIGGFNLKEAINLCFKEAMKDSLTPSFTWWDREEEQRALYNTCLVMAIYDGVCNNRHFQKPTRSEFQAQMKEILRTAKERLRHKRRGPRTQSTANRRRIHRDLWNDEQ
ncbi:uncharacterized protein [Linepithema humile]|uniref:uncharacterized protein n=1 Tax=Linepithema humile TaxID=83485 RepID=UPI00351E754B